MLGNLFHILSVLVHIVRRRSFLVLSGNLIPFPLGLKLAHFFLPNAELVQKHCRLGVGILAGHSLPLFFFHVAEKGLRLLFLVDRQLFDTLL